MEDTEGELHEKKRERIEGRAGQWMGASETESATEFWVHLELGRRRRRVLAGAR